MSPAPDRRRPRSARQTADRGAIDWSYDLLNPAEQKLFRRLSVFVGGGTLEGIDDARNVVSTRWKSLQRVGGSGTAACSGDLLLGALAACAQITCQMPTAAMGIETERIEVTINGDLDLRGTLGIAKDVPVGFDQIRVRFDVAPHATPEQLQTLREKTEQVLRRDANPALSPETPDHLGVTFPDVIPTGAARFSSARVW